MKNIQISKIIKDEGRLIEFQFIAKKDNGNEVEGTLKLEDIKTLNDKIESLISTEEAVKNFINEKIKEDLKIKTNDVAKLKKLLEKWIIDKFYLKGDIILYNEDIYECLENHQSNLETIPSIDNKTWKAIKTNKKILYETFNHERKYKKGDKCSFNQKNYELIIDTLEGYSPFSSPMAWKEI